MLPLMWLSLNKATASFLYLKATEQMLCCWHVREYLLCTSSWKTKINLPLPLLPPHWHLWETASLCCNTSENSKHTSQGPRGAEWDFSNTNLLACLIFRGKENRGWRGGGKCRNHRGFDSSLFGDSAGIKWKSQCERSGFTVCLQGIHPRPQRQRR